MDKLDILAKTENLDTVIDFVNQHLEGTGCPMKIAIPKYFKVYNENTFDDLEDKEWTVEYSEHPELLDGGGGKASDCLACGQCESVCPQHIPIIENLKKVAEHLQ